MRKSKRATLVCADFENALHEAQPGDVVYCDPPYAPLNDAESFTQYAGNRFTKSDQMRLASLARKVSENGVTVVISNHDSPDTRLLYAKARIHAIEVTRKVAAKARSRGVVQEIVAVYRPVNSGSRKRVQSNFPLGMTPGAVAGAGALML